MGHFKKERSDLDWLGLQPALCRRRFSCHPWSGEGFFLGIFIPFVAPRGFNPHN